jgi:nucleoside-diphosphate-sugar epimerase
MNKYVVTGGAGFIGSAIVRGLVKQGAGRVTVVDNLNTGHQKNLDDIHDSVDFHQIDIRDHAALQRAVAGAEIIFHEAAIPSVPRSIQDPVASHTANIDGTFNVLRAAVEGKVRRVVYAASSSAYGDTLTLPKVETMAPKPKSPYALQKLTGEYYMSVFASCYGLETVSLRYFNVYGPRQDPNSQYSGILSIFMKSILTGEAPTIFGDGEQSRDFTYVEDVVALNLKAAHAADVAGKVFNGGNGGRVTLNEAWKLVQRIGGKSIPAKFGSPRAGDVRDSQADTTAAAAELGHRPQYSFEEGMRLTLDWYRANHPF